MWLVANPSAYREIAIHIYKDQAFKIFFPLSRGLRFVVRAMIVSKKEKSVNVI